MKFYSLDSSPFKPVSHDPGLKKRVIVTEGFSCIKHVSHIVLEPGSTASLHSHADAFEVFYCVRGRAVFSIGEKKVPLKKGDCLVVEPHEEHAIKEVPEETELLYFHASG